MRTAEDIKRFTEELEIQAIGYSGRSLHGLHTKSSFWGFEVEYYGCWTSGFELEWPEWKKRFGAQLGALMEELTRGSSYFVVDKIEIQAHLVIVHRRGGGTFIYNFSPEDEL